jgi:hypothetical protein
MINISIEITTNLKDLISEKSIKQSLKFAIFGMQNQDIKNIFVSDHCIEVPGFIY